MSKIIATLVCVAGILGLFSLDRDSKTRTSKALWIPVIWLLINGSRTVSVWLNIGPAISQAEQYAEGSPLDATVFGILIAAGVLALNLRSRKVRGFLQQNLPILLFFSYCAISIIWSDFPFVALKRWIKAIGDIVMILIVLTDPNPRAATKRFLTRAAFVLLPLSVLFIAFYPELSSVYDQADRTRYYFGVTTTKNLLGMTCLVCGLGTLWSYIEAYEDRKMPHRARHLIANGLIFATAVWLIVKADSMTSLSCFVMGGVVMVMTTQRWVTDRARGMQIIVSAAVGIPLFAVFLDTAGSLLHALGRNTTLTGRVGIWKAVLSLQTNPLFGTGFESFWLGSRLQRVWDMTATGIQEAHNGYLEVYLNLGWIGIILLGTVIVTGYRFAFALSRRDPHAGRIRLAFLTAGVIYCLTEAGFRMLSPIWIAFLFATTIVPTSLQQMDYQRTLELPLTQVLRPKRVRILK
jgi:O-antigen ligase